MHAYTWAIERRNGPTWCRTAPSHPPREACLCVYVCVLVCLCVLCICMHGATISTQTPHLLPCSFCPTMDGLSPSHPLSMRTMSRCQPQNRNRPPKLALAKLLARLICSTGLGVPSWDPGVCGASGKPLPDQGLMLPFPPVEAAGRGLPGVPVAKSSTLLSVADRGW